jgi:hypothetical protein
MGDSSARQLVNLRLDSWKEIATFFGRDERTVRRWEKERALPIHRVPGGGRGGVFAYTDELRSWLKGRPDELDPSDSRSVESDETGGGPSKDSVVMAQVVELKPIPVATPEPSNPRMIRRVGWLAPLLLAAGLIAIFALRFSYRETRSKSKDALTAHQPNPEAQELYLKGEYHWTKRTPEDLNKAVDYFTQSIVKDPGYARAYVGLADSYNLLREFSVMPSDEAYPRALAAAQKAVELDDTSPGAHTSLAFSTYYWNWDPVTAEREHKRALELDPNFVQGHYWYATFLLTSHRYAEAMDQIEQARKLDPSSTTIQADKGWLLYNAGKKADAFTLLKQLESTDPALATTHRYLAEIYLDQQDYENYFAELKQAARWRHDEAALAVANAAELGFRAGGLEGMRKNMLPVQKENLAHGSGTAYDVAATCAQLGREDEALRYLQAAYEKREEGLLIVNYDPRFNTLHEDLEYKEITGRVGEKLSRLQPWRLSQ